MKLSIIIPLYNTKNCISRCIESALEISNLTYEIIIINDEHLTQNTEFFCQKISIFRKKVVTL